jgi:hypothetical protein
MHDRARVAKALRLRDEEGLGARRLELLEQLQGRHPLDTLRDHPLAAAVRDPVGGNYGWWPDRWDGARYWSRRSAERAAL